MFTNNAFANIENSTREIVCGKCVQLGQHRQSLIRCCTFTFPIGEPHSFTWPHSVRDMNALVPGIWSTLQEAALKLNSKVAHHCRRKLKHYAAGWGNYVLSVMGPARYELVQLLFDLMPLDGDTQDNSVPVIQFNPLQDTVDEGERRRIFDDVLEQLYPGQHRDASEYLFTLRDARLPPPPGMPRDSIRPYFEAGGSLAMCVCYFSKTQKLQNGGGILRAS